MTTTGKIYTSIPAIIADVGPVGKTETNQQQHYKYRSADAICDALHDALGKHKVFTTCEIVSREISERESKNGGVLFYVNLKTRYTFHAEDGSSVETDAWGEAMDSGDKATNKAMTAAYKYALLQVFCLMGHEDSETESPEPAPQKQAAKPPCPECGSAVNVYEDRNKGGFFCWKQKGGCGHNWLPGDERHEPSDLPPKANGKAQKIAKEHGMTTADKLAPPKEKSTFDRAVEEIEKAVKNADAAYLKTIEQLVMKRKAEGAVTQAEYLDLANRIADAEEKLAQPVA